MASSGVPGVPENGQSTMTSSATQKVIVESNPGAIDLSIKKSDEGRQSPVRVEIMPSAYEVKIGDLIIDTPEIGRDDRNEISSQGGGSRQAEGDNQQQQRGKKRKQPPEKIIQSCIEGGYVIREAPLQQVTPQQSVTIIQTPGSGETFIVSNGGEYVDVETVFEVETTSQTVGGEPVSASPIKIPTLTAVTVPVTTASEPASVPTTSSKQPPKALLGSPLFSSNGKSMRPFKLYTQNRDLLAGIGLDSDNMNTLAAALTGRPLAAPAAEPTVPIPVSTFAPITNPLIPTTIPTGVPSATTESKIGSTAGTPKTAVTIATSAVTTSTPSAMRLMTLATEADKILKEKKMETADPSQEKNSKQNIPVVISASSSGGNPGPTAMHGRIQDDGTIQFTYYPKQPGLVVTEEPKSKRAKKDRQSLPETMKTPNYWERRRKNNEAAKRSRDSRRAKEDQVAIRAAMLEHENTRMKIELAALREEVAKLRAELYERKKAD